MSTGKIKFFNSTKGFGFIIDDETGKDVFVHHTGLSGSFKQPAQDERVTFDVADGKRGKCAVNVQRG